MSHPYESFMREAAELAERGRWSAAPNPTVGAVLVRDGVVVARGWHTAYGKSHAEVECLKDAEAKGVDPSACTLVVTLEPCNHQGPVSYTHLKSVSRIRSSWTCWSTTRASPKMA